jgi:hypothetical protein
MSLRKPRSDSKLDALDLDQQQMLCEWLLTPGLSYERIKEMVFKEFNVSTTASSLSSFYSSYVAAYLIQRRAQAVGVAKELGAEVEKTPGQFSKATIDALEQKAFEFAQNPMVNPKDVKAIFSLVLKARDQEFDREKFAVATCETFLKWMKDEKAREIAAAPISNSEKISRLRQEYFADVDALEKSGAVVLPE